MPQSLVKNLVHLIYSTKNREPLIDASIRPRLYAYKAGILKQWESQAVIIGGVADHVHILFSLSKNHSLARIVEEVKKSSSKWIKEQGDQYAQFYWQAGYGAFSVSASHEQRVRTYIAHQEEHHRVNPFRKSSVHFCGDTGLCSMRSMSGIDAFVAPFQGLIDVG